MYRFLTRPAWIIALVGCILAALLMVRLGIWQLDRMEYKRDRIAAVEAATDAPARPIDEVLHPAVEQDPAGTDVWSKVTVTGEYDESAQVLVRGRSLEGDIGFHVLTPLVLADGSAVLVNRGFLPAPPGGDATAQPDVPSPPSGPVDVLARARASESQGETKPDHGEGLPTVRAIDVPALAEELGRPLYGGYLVLVSEDPEPASAPTPLPLPDLDEGPHLAYAVQWFLFSGMTLVGYGIFARREAAIRSGRFDEGASVPYAAPYDDDYDDEIADADNPDHADDGGDDRRARPPASSEAHSGEGFPGRHVGTST